MFVQKAWRTRNAYKLGLYLRTLMLLMVLCSACIVESAVYQAAAAPMVRLIDGS